MACYLPVKNSSSLKSRPVNNRPEPIILKHYPGTMFIKRIFDLVLTIPGIIILLPVFIILSVWIKLDSPGPVLFKQLRMGKNGCKFYIYKFRSMVVGDETNGKLFTLETDRRITRCGRVLRKFKFDELPQLYNVFKGEMSLVGPRPMLPDFLAKYPSRFRMVVLSVPPGITDYASVFYIDENKMLSSLQDPERVYLKEILQTKLSYAVYYITKRNLAMDLRIILITLVALVSISMGKNWNPIRREYISWK